MRKRDELTDPNSCLNRARDSEMVFVLLGRDENAPATIRYWISRRIAHGKNQPGDEQVVEAEQIARIMEEERRPKGGPVPDPRDLSWGDY
jgi:hypothetical protein